jgi:NADH pyrophosphatase NudC (nudix superfamily)
MHSLWTIPSGGVKRHETWEEAVRREVFEEVGIQLGAVEKVTEYMSAQEYKRDSIVVFRASVPSFNFTIDNMEVIEAKWFLPDEFPMLPLQPKVKRLSEFFIKK